MKKRIDIEKLLKWAYCEELPKALPDDFGKGTGERSAWQSIETYAQLLTRVDDNRYGVVSTLAAMDAEPHGDAVKVYEAVRALDDLRLTFPEGWNPMPEIDGHGAETERALVAARWGIANSRRTPSEIVQKHAILGGCPDWQGEVPAIKPVCNGDGRPVWFLTRVVNMLDEAGNPAEFRSETEDGWNRNTKAPKAGAYQRFRFDPDPTPTIMDRGTYQIWRRCLTLLVEKLAETLDQWRVEGPFRADCPWEGESGHGQAILPDLKISA